MQLARLRALALAGALLAPLSLGAARPRTQGDLLDRAVAAWAKVKTARATFEQTITNPLTGRTLTASGDYQQQRPGKLSVRFSQPANERIVADGSHLWLYLPSTTPGQVIRTSLKEGGSGTVDLSAQFLIAPRSRYTVTPNGTAEVSGRATHAFNLVPKQKEGAAFQTATVWIDDADATIRQFEVTEPSGTVRRVRLTSFRPNAPVDASAFTFTVPDGVRIVDR
ncbi:MAG: outer membrane lipoprotein carrier protein LolA [Gemmatimonadetes bacterium]|nr:MAG: outer membrane lipoprotein carrier protein LolA [Gemmatimonadota bacterium]